MKKYIIILISFLSSFGNYAQKNPEVYRTLAKKNFYFLYAIQQNKKIENLLVQEKTLHQIFLNRKKEISKSNNNENTNLDFTVAPYLISETESKNIYENLYRIYQESKIFRDFIKNDIRNSGAYFLFQEKEPKDFIKNVWNQNAEGINHILKVYGTGEPPQYAAIDSVSYNVQTDFYKNSIKMWSKNIYSELQSKKIWFIPSLDFALSLLYLNHRDEAARYEPLKKLENKNVAENIKHINFDDFQYNSILILGNGPENYRDRLSALGKLNIKLGAKEYLNGKAPLIVVSGGHAHPFRAEYCEAIEMKKELINEYHIPENNIIIEPHARHTTTNIRNATRLYLKYDIPITKSHLVITNNSHSKYLSSKKFLIRCQEELGYLPAKIENRISKTAIEFLPQKASLQQNPLEPLDP